MKRTIAVLLFLVSVSVVYAKKDVNLCMQQIQQEAQQEKKRELASIHQQYRTALKNEKSKKRKKLLKKTFNEEEKKILAAYRKSIKGSRKLCAEAKQELPPLDAASQELPCDGKFPIFMADITDFSKVSFVIPPVTIQGNYLKGHGYIKVSGRVPVYAPVDSVAFDGSFYSEDNRGQYSITFDVTCDVRYMVDHLSEAVPSLAEQLGTVPASDSRTKGLAPITFRAGDLIGYTIGTDLGKTWDFGVYNFTQQNPYNNPSYPDFESYKNKNAVCPYSYYDSAKRTFYKNLMRDAGGGPLTNQTNLCADL